MNAPSPILGSRAFQGASGGIVYMIRYVEPWKGTNKREEDTYVTSADR